MVFIESVSSFLKFAGQTSNKGHNVQKICLETIVFVYAYFIKFYKYFFYEIHVEGTKLE